MKVICLYGAGGQEFRAAHVMRFARMVRAYTPGVELVCLTDAPGEVAEHVDTTVALTPAERAWGWKRSWQKLAMLKIPGPCLYLDLDVCIRGNLTPLLEVAAASELAMSLDFWGMSPPHINASVVGWRGDLAHVYKEFARDPQDGMTLPDGCSWRWGDGQWLLCCEAMAETEIERFQWRLPGSIMSYKNEWLRGHPRDNCIVLVFHGQPRPWDVGM